MAATDMTKAGFEVGCKVIAVSGRGASGTVKAIDTSPINSYWLDITVDGDDGIEHHVNQHEVERDYDDAQRARQRRFGMLLKNYPGDAGVPEVTDTIERYVGVQESDSGSGAFVWSDDFDACASNLADDIYEGWRPEAIFDLDTGERIELHIGRPIITRSEDQGACVNVLEPGALQENAEYVEKNYELVGFTVALHAEVPAGAQVWCQRVADLSNQMEKSGCTVTSLYSQPIRRLKIKEA